MSDARVRDAVAIDVGNEETGERYGFAIQNANGLWSVFSTNPARDHPIIANDAASAAEAYRLIVEAEIE